MLPTHSRLHRPVDFRDVVRRGRRAARPLLTVHVLWGPSDVTRPGAPGQSTAGQTSGHSAGEKSLASQAGLVVGKPVGNAVLRHRTSRRLRHLLAPRLGVLPAGSRLVVRAAPAAGAATSAALAVDLDAALERLLTRRTR